MCDGNTARANVITRRMGENEQEDKEVCVLYAEKNNELYICYLYVRMCRSVWKLVKFIC